ncbi:hypothetical protein [Streptomyces geranii]|uniref:hypothetical protein n=1 Tax=Streptomyces geranii TaxID=2058923 RepID=UPI001300825D|nr:hypothetical protein [Streptomyces geranii]
MARRTDGDRGPVTPAERVERAATARAVLREWNGHDPDEHEQAELDAELDRRMTEAGVT